MSTVHVLVVLMMASQPVPAEDEPAHAEMQEDDAVGAVGRLQWEVVELRKHVERLEREARSSSVAIGELREAPRRREPGLDRDRMTNGVTISAVGGGFLALGAVAGIGAAATAIGGAVLLSDNQGTAGPSLVPGLLVAAGAGALLALVEVAAGVGLTIYGRHLLSEPAEESGPRLRVF